MSNIQIQLDEDKFISFYQDDNTGQLEIVPVMEEGGLIGEPIHINDVAELVDILIACQNNDFLIFENQYVFEFETSANDDWPIDRADD